MEIPYTVAVRRDTGLTNGKIGIWLFLASEVMLFGALFASYILIRTGAQSWPRGDTILNVRLATFNTLVLISSSVTMVMAWASLMRHRFGTFRIYMGGTILLGFVFLVVFILYRAFGSERGKKPGVLATLGLLSIAGVLLGTTGGFGAMVAVLFKEIRAYDRISIYIMLFALTAVGVGLDALRDRLARRRVPNAWWYAALAALLVLGLIDQVGAVRPADYAAARTRWAADGAYVRQVESSLAPGSMVFQLPYMFFPESPAVQDMPPYEPFIAYLHSRTLRWSFGAIHGREDDVWQQEVTALPTSEMLTELRKAGFAGIWVDRRGYADGGRAIEAAIAADTSATPIVKADGTIAFFALTPR